MTTDPRPGTNGLLLVVLALLTGYLAWQITPLHQRVDTMERRLLETEDRLFGEMERLTHEIASLSARRESTPSAASAARSAATEKPSGAPTPPPAPAPTKQAAASAPAPNTAELVRFFNKRLLPEDATIASLMASGTPLPEIARVTAHSIPYLLGKAAQIERTLSAAPDTPPEALRAIRRSRAQARGAE